LNLPLSNAGLVQFTVLASTETAATIKKPRKIGVQPDADLRGRNDFR